MRSKILKAGDGIEYKIHLDYDDTHVVTVFFKFQFLFKLNDVTH